MPSATSSRQKRPSVSSSYTKADQKSETSSSVIEEELSVEGLIAQFLEKKHRNLAKRKSRLEKYDEDLKKGSKLTEEQKEAIASLPEVNSMLEFVKEFQTTVHPMIRQAEKAREKKEGEKRAQSEASRIKELIKIQEILNMLGDEVNVRIHFKEGTSSAVKLSKEQLLAIDELYEAVCPSHEGLTQDAWNKKVEESSVVAYSLLTSSTSRFKNTGTTFKSLRHLLDKIMNCDFFHNKYSSGRTTDSPDNQGKSDTTSTISSDSQQRTDQRREASPPQSGEGMMNGGSHDQKSEDRQSSPQPPPPYRQPVSSYDFIQDDHSGIPQAPILQNMSGAAIQYGGALPSDVVTMAGSSYGGSVYSTPISLPAEVGANYATPVVGIPESIRGPPSPIPMPNLEFIRGQTGPELGSTSEVVPQETTESRNLPPDASKDENSIGRGMVASEDTVTTVDDGDGGVYGESHNDESGVRGRPIRGAYRGGPRGGSFRGGAEFRGRGGPRGGYSGYRGGGGGYRGRGGPQGGFVGNRGVGRGRGGPRGGTSSWRGGRGDYQQDRRGGEY